MQLPNFMIIGAPKSGSTSLFHWLRQHPEVYMIPGKEPNFFTVDGVPADQLPPHIIPGEDIIFTWAEYCTRFAGADHPAVGEASVAYLCSNIAPARIKERLGDIKFIVGLRQPVRRAYSHYLMPGRNGPDRYPTFQDSIQAEPRHDLSYMEFYEPAPTHLRRGLYAYHLQRWFKLFDRAQFFIYWFEDFQQDPLAVYADLCRHIGVDPGFKPDTSMRLAATGIPRSAKLHKLLTMRHPLKTRFKSLVPTPLRRRWMNRLTVANLHKPPIDPELYAELLEYFRADILDLQEMLGRDLSGWLELPNGK